MPLHERYLLDICFSLSSISEEDTIMIYSNLFHMYDPNYQCRYKKFNTELGETQFKLKNGCNFKKNIRPLGKRRFKDVIFNTCPCSFYTPEFNILMDLQQQMEKFGLNAILNIYNVNKISGKLYSALMIIQNYITERKHIESIRQQQAYDNKKKG